jgi:hypothetical protein
VSRRRGCFRLDWHSVAPQIAALRIAGVSVIKICDRLGLAQQTIYNRIKAMGLPTHPKTMSAAPKAPNAKAEPRVDRVAMPVKAAPIRLDTARAVCGPEPLPCGHPISMAALRGEEAKL